ncbi:MAG: HAMP domain-containing protein [Arcobacter sp.]|nr:HAMP domain-containing protein [Arcobacter sp.]
MIITNLSIRHQLVFFLLIISTVMIFVFTYFNFINIIKLEKDNFMKKSVIQANLLADFSVSAVVFRDYEGARENLDKLKKDNNILRVIILDNKKEVFAQYNPFNLNEEVNLDQINKPRFYEENGFLNIGVLKLSVYLKHKDKKYGILYMEKATNTISQLLKAIFIKVIMFAFVLLLITYIISIILSNHILKPILSLAYTTERIAYTQNYKTRVKYNSENEIGILYNAFNTLVEDTQKLTDNLEYQVKYRTKELNKKTIELENSLNYLKQAQQQLIESEKMSALGNLVSGIAHEVNTPLGNAITSSSIIEKETEYLKNAYDNQTLTKSDMENRLDILNQSSFLLIKTLNYASELIKSFKQISVDQVTNDVRKIKIQEYIREVFLTNHNKLKLVPAEVIIEGEENKIKTSPGIIAQIFNNLIQNSITHAFENYKGNAQIKVLIKKENENLIIEYQDNGIGIKDDIKDHIYEPFVTTKRNFGGTGLGLNIVYNLVHQKLKGSIQMETLENKGTKFIFTLPIKNSFKEIK